VYDISQCITPLFHDLGSRWNGERSPSLPGWFTSRGKESLFPLNSGLPRPQGLSGCLGEEKNLLPVLGIEPQIGQPIA
jgi:hypothetical protein